jgi:polysaccharide deacetylase 2 family uncharacterized protein YibQ
MIIKFNNLDKDKITKNKKLLEMENKKNSWVIILLYLKGTTNHFTNSKEMENIMKILIERKQHKNHQLLTKITMSQSKWMKVEENFEIYQIYWSMFISCKMYFFFNGSYIK